MSPGRAHQQGVPVRCGAGDDLAADNARGTGPIVRYELLAHVLAEFSAYQTCKNVSPAASRERHDEPDGLRRISLRPCFTVKEDTRDECNDDANVYAHIQLLLDSSIHDDSIAHIVEGCCVKSHAAKNEAGKNRPWAI
jgi:hypothetical protein